MRRPSGPIDPLGHPINRRRLLHLGAAASWPGFLESRQVLRAAAATQVGESGGGQAGVGAAPAARPVLYRNADLADGRSATLQTRISVFTDGGRVGWIRPSDSEGDPGPSTGLEVVNATGLTIVPGLVDAHCHLTSPGGADWLDYFRDPHHRSCSRPPNETASSRATQAPRGCARAAARR